MHDLQADCLAAITLINAPENGWHEFPLWLTETVSFPGDNDFFKAYASYIGGGVNDAIATFDEAFCGEFASEEDYAQDMAEEAGTVDSEARWPLYCIDWQHAWRELQLGGDNFSVPSPNGYYIFRGNI